MNAMLPDQVISCSQCGGELHPEAGQIFLTCPYCTATVYLDKARVVFHWYLAPTLDQSQAQAALMRWMAGSQTVKDLDRKASLVSSSFEYFPVWYFKRRLPGGREELELVPAAATSITEINQIRLPAGDLRKYDGSIDAQAHLPTVPLEAALVWGAAPTEQAAPPEQAAPTEQAGSTKQTHNGVIEQSLVHIPLYTFKYAYQNQTYTALVEAGTGSVLASLYPAKAELPYRGIGLVTALIFLFLAVIPVAMAAVSGWEGSGIGLLICLGLGVVFVPILFAIAASIAAKV